MRSWWKDRGVEILMILGVLLIIGLLVYATWDNCSHGHHEGVCGREYKSGKLRTLKVCDCVKDHY